MQRKHCFGSAKGWGIGGKAHILVNVACGRVMLE